MPDTIFIKGAREHNLKNIDVSIPREKLVVINGASGSGKSSLAFDTIYAEGQRRYVESLSAYARQFLGQMQKPDVLRTNPETGEEIRCKTCDLEDYRIAYDLFTAGILKNSGFDIPAGTRKLYEAIRAMAAKSAAEQNLKVNEVSFIQKQVRTHTQLGGEFIKKHLRILINFEYLEVKGGRRHGTRYAYRLREDKPIEEMDISMITTLNELKKLIEGDEIF